MELTITDANFNEVISNNDVVIIDFWATWCGPCRALAPVVEALAEELEGKVVVGKCNVDECDDVPSEQGIRSIPTILYFKGGQLAGRTVGLVSREDILSKIASL